MPQLNSAAALNTSIRSTASDRRAIPPPTRYEHKPCHLFVSISAGKNARYQQDIGRAVHDALVSVGVPKNDRFQIVGEHEADDFLLRSDDLVMIQITWSEGRTVEQKKALYRAIADNLANKPDIRPEDVFINLVEVKKENWSFGNGVAQYA